MRVTTFWGFEIYTKNYMTLCDFDIFFFFPWILCFLCASLHATDFVKKWCKTKWSCFYINAWAFVILTTFCVKKHYLNVLISKGRPRNNDLWNWFSLDLGVQMRWYLDWGSFRVWKTFSKILVNRCWLNIAIEASVGKKLVKNRQKGNCWPKRWGVFAILVLGSWYSGEK